MNWLVVMAGGFVLLILSSTVLRVLENRARAKAWREIAAARRRFSEERRQSTPDYDQLDEHWGAETSPGRRLLILKLTQIESESGRLLDSLLGQRDRQLFEVRAELNRLGIWSDTDVETFDRAMTIRNAIVHGSQTPTRASNSVSARDLDELLEKLQSKLPR